MPRVSKNPDKKVFKDMYFVLQGNFTSNDLSARQNEVRSHKNIAKLILKYGGGVDQNVTSRTNHVITTINEFKRNPPNIQIAKTRGKARLRILVFEYIEDALLKPGLINKAQSANFHEIDQVLSRLGRRKEAREAYRTKKLGEVKKGDDFIDARFHHVYKDSTGFEYKVALKRNIESLKTLCFEKYTVILFESNAIPYSYMVGVHFNRPGMATKYLGHLLVPSMFDKSFKSFKAFFRSKTGISWDKRLDNIKIETLERAVGERGEGEETIAADKRPFIYIPPNPNSPRGELPGGWEDPVEKALRREKETAQARKEEREHEECLEEATRHRKAMKLHRTVAEDAVVEEDSEDGYGGLAPSDDEVSQSDDNSD